MLMFQHKIDYVLHLAGLKAVRAIVNHYSLTMLLFQQMIDCVLHLAGLKAVRESYSQLLHSYNVNVSAQD